MCLLANFGAQDLLIYSEAVERQLREDNTRLLAELSDTQLDLEDSKRSRRELQQKLNMVTQKMGQSTADADQLRVCWNYLSGIRRDTDVCRIETHILLCWLMAMA